MPAFQQVGRRRPTLVQGLDLASLRAVRCRNLGGHQVVTTAFREGESRVE